MSVPRRIAAFLDLAAQDADAARTLATTKNRYAAYHCQQAAEKLMKAVLLHRGRESGTEHRLDALVDGLPDSAARSRACLHRAAPRQSGPAPRQTRCGSSFRPGKGRRWARSRGLRP